jgi:hypothetical protein
MRMGSRPARGAALGDGGRLLRRKAPCRVGEQDSSPYREQDSSPYSTLVRFRSAVRIGDAHPPGDLVRDGEMLMINLRAVMPSVGVRPLTLRSSGV